MNNIQFYNMIHRRGVTASDLAKKTGCGRAHLTLVLNGKREGRHTWPRLRGVLDCDEYDCAFGYASREWARLVDQYEKAKRAVCDSMPKGSAAVSF